MGTCKMVRNADNCAYLRRTRATTRTKPKTTKFFQIFKLFFCDTLRGALSGAFWGAFPGTSSGDFPRGF